MLTYFFEVTIYWSAFYIFYFLLFSRETFFNGNRFYLLATFFAGLMFPLFELSNYVPENTIFEVVLPAIQVTADGLNQPVFTEESTSVFTFFNILKTVLFIGACLTAARFFIGFFKIIRLKNKAEKSQISGVPVFLTSEIHTPFSFFNNLFWSTQLAHLSAEEKRQIVLHESAHMKKLHSLDVVLIELVAIVFWWNPLAYAFKKSLREIHEFQADDYAIRQTNKQQYGRLLITQSRTFTNLLTGSSSPALANHFFHSQLKKRIMMMTKKKSAATSQWKYLLVLPLLMTLVFACETVVQNEMPEIDEATKERIAENDKNVEYLIDTIITFNPETYEESMQIVKHSVLKVAEVMPRFPGCEDEEGGDEEKKACAQQRMLEHIYKSLKYPTKAKDDGVEGMVVASFIVGTSGEIYDTKVVRNLSPECDAEVLRVIGEMPPWNPGMQAGKNVNVRFHLPIKFKLQ